MIMLPSAETAANTDHIKHSWPDGPQGTAYQPDVACSCNQGQTMVCSSSPFALHVVRARIIQVLLCLVCRHMPLPQLQAWQIMQQLRLGPAHPQCAASLMHEQHVTGTDRPAIVSSSPPSLGSLYSAAMAVHRASLPSSGCRLPALPAKTACLGIHPT